MMRRRDIIKTSGGPSGSIKAREILEYLNSSPILKKCSTPYS
jgi:hypothetical protein